ncbi:DUF3376 domain-containing protein [Streptomyces phaeochromogenes]|uniref:DUF3376 domain-containing protein n=1 Tax=Streptomyces phaeochromogenes TaxID=1923 RepID=UPI00386767DC|nr:DUF3376 domain-containing protein [Streptomyces phaeochromogenes]
MSEHEEEIRVALVMNGGVSLAVWMGGVTHEIDLLRRASDPEVPPDMVRQNDQPVFNRWRGACETPGGLQRRVVVDVVAGTSAGGLNGTLLATAIARGTALDPASDAGVSGSGAASPKLKNIWREDAALEFNKLLPRPGARPRPSILDGTFFAHAVDRVLTSIQEPDEPHSSPPVTLFVTATSTGPDAQLYLDAFGNSMACPDHRRVYCFEKRAGQYTYRAEGVGQRPWEEVFTATPRDDFAPATGFPNALVSVARSSASYPLAFAPVCESELPATLRAGGVGHPSWLMDGGVLDNAPFGPVLEAIAKRELSGRVRRLLAYVVPSAGALTPAADQYSEPRWTHVLGSAIQLPREADLRTDVEAIQSLLGQADGLGVDSREFFATLLSDPDQREQATTTAQLLLPTYRGGRIIGGIFDARRLVATASLAPTQTAQTAEDLGGTVPRWVPEAGAIGLAEDDWQWGVAGAERTVRLFVRDLRRRLEDAPGDADVAKGLSELSTRWLPRIDAVKRAFTDSLRERLDESGDAPAGDVVAIVNEVIEELQTSSVLAWLVGEASTSYCEAAMPGLGHDEVVQCALNVEVISRAFQARSPSRAVAPFEFLRLGPDVDTPVLNTPVRAQAREKAEHKLYGTQLAHFGAFGDASWRDWDWLIGRLDAVAHLGHVLGQNDDWIRETQLAVLTSENVSHETLSAHMASMLDASSPGLLGDLKSLPDNRGRDLVRNIVDSAADGLAHLEYPPVLRRSAHILAHVQRPLRWWMRLKGF